MPMLRATRVKPTGTSSLPLWRDPAYRGRVTTYVELPGLEHLYLEDSWVLAVHESESTFYLDVDAVLTHHHPQWRPAKHDEQYCYRHVRILFERVTSVHWIEKSMQPTRDPDGSIDFGNIHSFTVDGEEYRIDGEFGRVVVVSASPPVVRDL